MKKVSPTPRAPRKKRIKFTYEAPEARSVLVTGSFSGWKEASPLKKDKEGLWSATMTLSPGRYEYRFLVDGEWRNDPKSSERTPNPFGAENSVVTV